MQELAPAVCQASVCKNAGSRHSKCLAAVGLDGGHAPSVAIAYFCVPLDVAQFVTVYRGLPFKAGTREYALATGAELLGTHLLTTTRVAEPAPRRELLLTLSRDAGVWGLDVLEPAPVRLLCCAALRPPMLCCGAPPCCACRRCAARRNR